MSQIKQMIFVNLPVKDLNRSIAFYKSLGMVQNMQYSDETAACMVLSETIFVMLLTHPKWISFTKKDIPDAKKSAQVMLAINRDSKQAVDQLILTATQAGGFADPNPTQDLGFMYSRSLEDPDGHIWESFWMNTNQ